MTFQLFRPRTLNPQSAIGNPQSNSPVYPAALICAELFYEFVRFNTLARLSNCRDPHPGQTMMVSEIASQSTQMTALESWIISRLYTPRTSGVKSMTLLLVSVNMFFSSVKISSVFSKHPQTAPLSLREGGNV